MLQRQVRGGRVHLCPIFLIPAIAAALSAAPFQEDKPPVATQPAAPADKPAAQGAGATTSDTVSIERANQRRRPLRRWQNSGQVAIFLTHGT
jgi:hypothetical protein